MCHSAKARSKNLIGLIGNIALNSHCINHNGRNICQPPYADLCHFFQRLMQFPFAGDTNGDFMMKVKQAIVASQIYRRCIVKLRCLRSQVFKMFRNRQSILMLMQWPWQRRERRMDNIHRLFWIGVSVRTCAANKGSHRTSLTFECESNDSCRCAIESNEDCGKLRINYTIWEKAEIREWRGQGE